MLYFTGPPAEFVPPHLVGTLLCGMPLTHAGPEAGLRRFAEPLLALPHEAEVVGAVPYADLQCMIDDPLGLRNYWSAQRLTGLPDEAVDVHCARAATMPVPSGTHPVPAGRRDLRRAVRLPGALPGRLVGGASLRGVGGPGRRRTRHPMGGDVRADVRPWSTGAVYLNFIGDEGADRVVAGLGTENARRLAELKRRYDPDNVFRFNHNIRPA